ncbi:aminomethyl transferase family protein [Candidatus Poriferisodalis sp.]|uniref:aminomethyl transferase family protein n=1 Tax=Candidatus Poriferisodalis sp. TaxID=3101277 RepID=UPI003B5B3196
MSGSLQDKLDAADDVVSLFRNAPAGFYEFPVPSEHTNWRDEQRAWVESAVLFDQSFHMTDVHLRGPERIEFLEAIALNKFGNFDELRAIQLVVCADNGGIIGDAVAFHEPGRVVNIVGKPSAANYICYAAETLDYDISIEVDRRVLEDDWQRSMYRFQIQGPNAFDILEVVNGGPLPQTRFFEMCEFTIAGRPCRGLRHGMASAPGLEFWGDYADREAVLAAVTEAGEAHGLRRGGGRVYSTAGPQSGWVGAVLPAVYTGDGDMAAYRRWLPDTSYEATLSIGGSYVSNDIEDYYLDPWDLGYHRFIDWDREFKGSHALAEKRYAGNHRRKVWLRWKPEDVLTILGSLLAPGPTYKYLETPAGHYSSCPRDTVLVDGQSIGLSIYSAYTFAAGGWFSIGIIEGDAVDFGQEVTVVWGEPDGGTDKPTVERHEQFEIRATMTESALG